MIFYLQKTKNSSRVIEKCKSQAIKKKKTASTQFLHPILPGRKKKVNFAPRPIKMLTEMLWSFDFCARCNNISL